MTSLSRSLLMLSLIAVIGIACTVLVYLSALRQDELRIRSLLEFHAEWRASDLAWKLEGLGQSVLSVAATIAADPALSVERMRRIDAKPLARQDAISAFAWLPRVPHDRRGQFEAEARAAGIDGYRITEATAGGFVPAATRAEYYPILHAWVFDGQPPGLGFDLLSDPGVRAAAFAARDSGSVAATVPLRSPITGRVTIVPVAPLYVGDGIPVTLDDRRSQLRGFVVGRVQLIRSLDLAIVDTPDIAEDIYLFNDAAQRTDGRVEPFAECRASEGRFDATGTPVDLAGLPGRVVIKPISVFNTRWMAAFHFPPEVLAGERWTGLWGLIVAGLLATAGVMAFFWREALQSSRSERLVAERTADLATRWPSVAAPSWRREPSSSSRRSRSYALRPKTAV